MQYIILVVNAHRMGIALIINTIQIHMLTWSNNKLYLDIDKFRRKSIKFTDATPIFFSIRFLKTRIPALL